METNRKGPTENEPDCKRRTYGPTEGEPDRGSASLQGGGAWGHTLCACTGLSLESDCLRGGEWGKGSTYVLMFLFLVCCCCCLRTHTHTHTHTRTHTQTPGQPCATQAHNLLIWLFVFLFFYSGTSHHQIEGLTEPEPRKLTQAHRHKNTSYTSKHKHSRCGAPMGHGRYIHATGRAPPYTTGATGKYEFVYKQSPVQARCALRAAWGRGEWSSDPDEGCQGGPRGYKTTELRDPRIMAGEAKTRRGDA